MTNHLSLTQLKHQPDAIVKAICKTCCLLGTDIHII